MNKEELELVIQAIEKLGNAGQAAFIWWLVFNFLSSLIIPSTWVMIAITAAKAIKTSITHCNDTEFKLAELKEKLKR